MAADSRQLPDQGVRTLGTTVVEVITPRGERYSIRDIGIGHPIHAVGPKGGRVATDAECALFYALMAERGHDSEVARLRAALDDIANDRFLMGQGETLSGCMRRRAREALNGGEAEKPRACCNVLDASLQPCADCPEDWNGGDHA